MSEKLLEADFLTVNLGALTNNAKSNEESSNKSETETNQDASKQQKKAITDWGKELKSRIDDNKALSADARLPEYKIETQLFTEFFTELFKGKEDLVKQALLIGEVLRKDIKTLGFKKQTNPIIAFLSLSYVQQNLLHPGLLNANTFKAIHNAIANHLIADSEFFKANDYNIIYCRDLYTKPLQDMVTYLELQEDELSVSAKSYDVAMLERNRRIFIDIPSIKELEPSKRAEAVFAADISLVSSVKSKKAKLNSLSIVRALQGGGNKDKENKSNTVHLTASAQRNLIAKLNTPAKRLAAVQFLSINTGSTKAQAALTSDKFGMVTTDKLLKATKEIAAFMPKGRLGKKDADAIVDSLLSEL